MALLLTAILVLASGLLAALTGVFALEVLAAVLARPKEDPPAVGPRGTAAILVPAHNEGDALRPTLADLKAQLAPGDRLLVVADNCNDDTAAVARAEGCEVVERHDPARRGKGYALDFGIRHLRADPPAVVIVVDADCRVAPGSVERLAAACALTGRPAQALDLMVAPARSAADHRLAEFAWRVKNLVRPLGLRNLGLPCQLMGTGMAFPWATIAAADLAGGHLVEDLKLGLELAEAGRSPLFCPTAAVTSEFPSSAEGTASQRQRWEGGHLSTIATAALPLLLKAIRGRNRDLLALAADMAVPPLTLLALLLGGAFAVTGLAFAAGLSAAPFVISTLALAAFLVAAGLSWFRYGRDLLPLQAIWALAPFVSGKARLYGSLMVRGRRPAQWTRTDRRDTAEK